jgi:hypothetical protein
MSVLDTRRFNSSSGTNANSRVFILMADSRLAGNTSSLSLGHVPAMVAYLSNFSCIEESDDRKIPQLKRQSRWLRIDARGT